MSDLSTELFGGGEAVASGHLVVNARKAREKLQKFRLPDPHLYILQLVRAASVLGASKVSFDIDANEMECEFDVELDGDLLADIWNSALGDRETSEKLAANHLALGLASAQALRPKQIVIESGNMRLTVRDDDEELVELEEPSDGTRIHLVEKFRLGHLVEFFTALRGKSTEIGALWNYCSLASVEITVNGTPVADLPPQPPWLSLPGLLSDPVEPVQFDEGPDRGVVGLKGHPRYQIQRSGRTKNSRGWIGILHHDVLIGSEEFEGHTIPAAGVVHSDRLRTDISGLVLRYDSVFEKVMRGPVTSAYHRSLLRWATSKATRSHLLEIATSFFSHLRELRERSLTEGTNEFLEWLADQPLLVSARGDLTELSLRTATTHQRIRYARRRFPRLAGQSEEPVVLVSGPLGSDRSQRHTLSILREWGREVGAVALDVTASLDQEEARRRNVEIWSNQPKREEPKVPFAETVTHEGLTGVVYIPVPEATGEANGDFALKIHVDGRLLRQHDWRLPFAVDVDGRLEPNASHSDIVPDDRVETLVAKLASRVPGVMDAYARALLDAGTDTPLRPRPLDLWISSLVTNSFATHFVGAFGFGRDAIARVARAIGCEDIRSPFGLGLLLGPANSRTGLRSALDLLGVATEVRSFRSSDGELRSLRALLESDDAVRVMEDSHESRALLQELGDELPHGVQRSIILADSVQHALLVRMGTNVVNVRKKLTRELARHRFHSRPKWSDGDRAVRVLHQIEDSSGDDSFEMKLLYQPLSGRSVTFLFLLLDDRLLAKKVIRSDDPGTYRAVVHSGSVTPTGQYDGVVEDAAYLNIVERLGELRRRLRAAWLLSAAKRETVGELSRSVRQLYFDTMAERAREPEWLDRAVVPIVEMTMNGLRRRLTTVREIDEAIAARGGVLPYLDSKRVNPETRTDDGPILDLRGAQVTVVRSIWPGARLVDVSLRDFSAVARARFWEDAPRPLKLRSPVTSTLRTNGLEFRTAMSRSATDGTGPHVVHASVLYEGRELERLEIPVPFGSFRAIVSGDAIGPGPEFQTVVAGRGAVVDALPRAAAQTIRYACARVAEISDGDVVDDLESVRKELIRMLALCHDEEPPPPFDLAEDLKTTPLFRTTAGRWLSYRELPGIVHGLRLPYDHRGESDSVLSVPPNDLPLYSRASQPYVLVPAPETPFAAAPSPPEDAKSPSPDDAFLRRLRTLLLTMRGDRVDLLDDRLAHELKWGSEARPDAALCEVTVDGLTLRRDHPLVRRALDTSDNGPLLFVALLIYSEVNRFYEEITDPDDLEFLSLALASQKPS